MENQKNEFLKTKSIVNLFCPRCGNKFPHNIGYKGRLVGGASGASAGAILGAKVGIAMGPLGAIAGTVPGAVLGGLFGKGVGKKHDNPKCPSCGINFSLPDSLNSTTIFDVKIESKEQLLTLPKQVVEMIETESYFELAEYLVFMETKNDISLIREVLDELKKINLSLYNKVEKVRIDLRKRNGLI